MPKIRDLACPRAGRLGKHVFYSLSPFFPPPNILPTAPPALFAPPAILLTPPFTPSVALCPYLNHTVSNALTHASIPKPPHITTREKSNQPNLPSQRPLRLNRPPLIVFASPLSPVNPFLGEVITQRLRKSALPHLSADKSVDAVLEAVDLRDACYFGLVEVFWCVCVRKT